MASNLVIKHGPCPSCTSSDAYCEYEDGHGYCFSCGTYFPGKERFDLLDTTFTYEYIPHRGINKDTFRYYDTRTKVNGDGEPVAVGFPYSNGAYKVRSLKDKEFHTKEGPLGANIADAGLFGMERFPAGSHKYVTITEGEYDALSLYQVLRSPVVSVQSSVTAARDCARTRSWLNSFERIYVAFDNDEPGRAALRDVARLFDYNKVYVVKFTTRKDANEYLQNGEDQDLYNIWSNSKKYLPENVLSSFKEFDAILREVPRKGVPYPFDCLNRMTYGIRTSESVLITAQEGVGKTELMHAIEHQLLESTDDPIAAIYLEEPKRRHLQAMAGLALGRPAHLPDSGVTDDEVVVALRRLVREDDRLHLYSHFGSDDPEVLADTVRFLVSARGCRYVLLDHITMAVSGLAGEDERRALDYLSTRLEMMVKELDFSLIFVSHVNDHKQTRGSRLISKIADIRIDLERDLQHADDKERNTSYLTVAKNRFCGKTGFAGKLLFNPITYSYFEEGMDFNPPQFVNDNSETQAEEAA